MQAPVKAPLPDAAFWRNQRVLLTGHTGFKGGWAALWLARLGANVTGFALPPSDTPALYETARIADICRSRLGDLRDRASLTWSAECLRQLDPKVLTPVIEGRWLEGYDLPSLLSGVRCPTLLLQADPSAGGALTDGDAETLKSLVADCQHVRFPGCGHNLHRDRPKEVLQALESFAAL